MAQPRRSWCWSSSYWPQTKSWTSTTPSSCSQDNNRPTPQARISSAGHRCHCTRPRLTSLHPLCFWRFRAVLAGIWRRWSCKRGCRRKLWNCRFLEVVLQVGGRGLSVWRSDGWRFILRLSFRLLTAFLLHPQSCPCFLVGCSPLSMLPFRPTFSSQFYRRLSAVAEGIFRTIIRPKLSKSQKADSEVTERCVAHRRWIMPEIVWTMCGLWQDLKRHLSPWGTGLS